MISLLAAGCDAPGGSLPATPSAPPGPTAASVSASPSPTPVADVIEPGQPFDAEALLAAMRDSTRPGGVPDQLQTDAIAAELADAIWTFDGEPWTIMAVSGSCGSKHCTLDVAGTRTGTEGDDVWVFQVTPESGAVELVSANLHSLPSNVVEVLDEQVREATNLDGMLLASARWLPPPHAGDFVLSYRSGDEEGSCMRDITWSSVIGEIVRDEASGC